MNKNEINFSKNNKCYICYLYINGVFIIFFYYFMSILNILLYNQQVKYLNITKNNRKFKDYFIFYVKLNKYLFNLKYSF